MKNVGNGVLARAKVLLKGGQHENKEPGKKPDKTPRSQWALLRAGEKTIEFWTDLELLKDHLIQYEGHFDTELAEHIHLHGLSERARGLFSYVHNIVLHAKEQGREHMFENTSEEFRTFCNALYKKLPQNNEVSLTTMALNICGALLKRPHSILHESAFLRITSEAVVQHFYWHGKTLEEKDRHHVALLCVVDPILMATEAFQKRNGNNPSDLQRIDFYGSLKRLFDPNPLYSHMMKVYDCEPDTTPSAAFYVEPHEINEARRAFAIDIYGTDKDFDVDETSYGVALLEPGHQGLGGEVHHRNDPCVYVYINNEGVFVKPFGISAINLQGPFNALTALHERETRLEIQIYSKGFRMALLRPPYKECLWNEFYNLHLCIAAHTNTEWRALVKPRGRRISEFRVWRPPVIIPPPVGFIFAFRTFLLFSFSCAF